jgi:hypothetical protein
MRMKLIARIMAEGVRDMFSLLHATIRKHGQQLETVRLRNALINVDPRGWKTRDDMTINVGLGTGRRGAAIRASNGHRQRAEADAGWRREQSGRRCAALQHRGRADPDHWPATRPRINSSTIPPPSIRKPDNC